ncbi:MAG: GatB/YqeY domain-containing protein, partial [Patescibacteria group bacterium]
MSLTDTLAATLKTAQKANDVLTRDTLRLLLSAIQNEEIDARGKGKENLEDEDVSRVLQREAKKRKESILAYRAGKREALAEQEEKELKIIEGYLPEALSEEEVTRVALEVIGEV